MDDWRDVGVLGLNETCDAILRRAGLDTVGQVRGMSEGDLLKLPNCGKLRAASILEALAQWDAPLDAQPSMEWGVAKDSTPDVVHRGPMSEQDARAWVDEWEQDIEGVFGARSGMFVVICREVGPWTASAGPVRADLRDSEGKRVGD